MIKIEAAQRLLANEDYLQLLDPVSDSLNHALICLNKAKSTIGPTKQVLALSQKIKDALTELQILQEELEE
jgi:hypothetical protein